MLLPRVHSRSTSRELYARITLVSFTPQTLTPPSRTDGTVIAGCLMVRGEQSQVSWGNNQWSLGSNQGDPSLSCCPLPLIGPRDWSSVHPVGLKETLQLHSGDAGRDGEGSDPERRARLWRVFRTGLCHRLTFPPHRSLHFLRFSLVMTCTIMYCLKHQARFFSVFTCTYYDVSFFCDF